MMQGHIWSHPGGTMPDTVIGTYEVADVPALIFLLFFTKCPQHAKQGLAEMLTLPISLWMVGCFPCLLYIRNLAEFLDEPGLNSTPGPSAAAQAGHNEQSMTPLTLEMVLAV